MRKPVGIDWGVAPDSGDAGDGPKRRLSPLGLSALMSMLNGYAPFVGFVVGFVLVLVGGGDAGTGVVFGVALAAFTWVVMYCISSVVERFLVKRGLRPDNAAIGCGIMRGLDGDAGGRPGPGDTEEGVAVRTSSGGDGDDAHGAEPDRPDGDGGRKGSAAADASKRGPSRTGSRRKRRRRRR